jgi:hypothetical protein
MPRRCWCRTCGTSRSAFSGRGRCSGLGRSYQESRGCQLEEGSGGHVHTCIYPKDWMLGNPLLEPLSLIGHIHHKFIFSILSTHIYYFDHGVNRTRHEWHGEEGDEATAVAGRKDKEAEQVEADKYFEGVVPDR